MIGKWLGSVDFGKLALDTTSGFIVTTAILFILDACSAEHVISGIFSDNSAGSMVVYALVIVVGSGVLGLMVDSIFHTFGRNFAALFWGPLHFEFFYRQKRMEAIDFLERDFEWIYASGKDNAADDAKSAKSSNVEKNYIRFTEVAGSAAYTMLFLLAPASFLFLRLECRQTVTCSIVVAVLVLIGGFVLLLTSAASLTKYEKKKTSLALDDIRKISTVFDNYSVKSECKNSRRWSTRLLWLVLPVAFAGLLLSGSGILAEIEYSKERKDMSTVLISREVKGSDNVTGVPEICLSANITSEKSVNQTGSIVVVLNDWLQEATSLSLRDNDLVALADNPDLKWHVNVRLADDKPVRRGDRVYIYATLSIDKSSADDISVGDWILPVIVTSGNKTSDNVNAAIKEYLLAHVHLQINPEPLTSDENADTDDNASE